MITLNYKIIGEGQPIILLHGLFGMLDNWQSFGKALAEKGFMAILVDQRDHGKSPFTDEFDYHILAEDLGHFMEENWIFEAIILGHSMGGKTAMRFALDHEDKVQKLIVVDIAPKAYHGGHEKVFQALEDINLLKVSTRTEIHEHLKSILGDDEATIQFLLKNVSRLKEGGYEWKMNVSNLKKNYSNILSEIHSNYSSNIKSLFIRGGDSNYIQEEDMTNISLLFPNSEIKTIPNAGHWIHADKPQELLKIVLEFLEEN